MLGRKASHRARMRAILAPQEGVELRYITPPDYTEESVTPPQPPPAHSEAFEGTSTPTAENRLPPSSLLEERSHVEVAGTGPEATVDTRRIENESQGAVGTGRGDPAADAMASNGEEVDSATVISRGGRLREIQERFDILRKRNANFTCFLCCHVRTGTIVIGFWHMLLHLMALSLIAIVVIHPEMLMPNGNSGGGSQSNKNDQLSVIPQDVQAVNCRGEMPCILAAQGDGSVHQSATDLSLSLGNLLTTHRLNTDEVNVALFITLCTFVVTLLLVYGAFRGQSSHLMPFFFLQVFDFCISSMTMIGYLSYLPNIRQLIRDTPAFPFQQQLLGMNTRCLTFVVMVIFITTLMAKGYCISIVWRCYKYLMLKQQAGQSVLRYLGSVSGPVDQESQTLVVGHDVPDYDMADPQYRKKLRSLYPEPPPSYDVSMAALVSQQEHDRRNCEGATVADAGRMDVAGAVCPSYEQSISEGIAGAPTDLATTVNVTVTTIPPPAIVTPNSSNTQQ